MTTSPDHREAGFGLVEVMVGVVIGMLAIIVMMQVFSLSEERKRTTTGGGDAQSTGVIAFYQLQRDIGQAGYGFGTTELFNCNLTWQLGSGANIATPIRLAPVTINPVAQDGSPIIPAGDPNTDTILVAYGSSNGQPQGFTIDSQMGASYKVSTPTAFSAGDRVIAAPAACSTNLLLDSVNTVDNDTRAVTVATGATGIVVSTLYNLGPEPTVLAYRIHNGNLTVCNFVVNDCGLDANKNSDSIWAPIASNVVSLKALYAHDTSMPMDGIPDPPPYDKITPGSAADTSGFTPGCSWARVSAISLALVARSSQFEKEAVPSAAPTWSGATVNPIVLTMKPDGSTNPDWQHYRYKVFEGIVPIRNVAWMGVPSGC